MMGDVMMFYSNGSMKSSDPTGIILIVKAGNHAIDYLSTLSYIINQSGSMIWLTIIPRKKEHGILNTLALILKETNNNIWRIYEVGFYYKIVTVQP